MKFIKNKIVLFSALFLILSVIIVVGFYKFTPSYKNIFIGEYEVCDLALTFSDYDYKKDNIDISLVKQDSAYPKERYYLKENEFYKLFNTRRSKPYSFKEYSYNKVLNLYPIEINFYNIKNLSKEEISKDRFLNEFNKITDLKSIKNGYMVCIFEKYKHYNKFKLDKHKQYFYFIDDKYYTYDELYGYEIKKLNKRL